MPLTEGYFRERSTVEIARGLLGKELVHESCDGITSGIIVETEAYLSDDPACHASRGMTKRNSSMFLGPGRSYVYFIYGNYYCFNVVTAEEGIGEAVLIRAIKPMEGTDLMAARRGLKDELKLASGPGKLCSAMGIDKKLDGASLWQRPFYIRQPEKVDIGIVIVETTRIGINRAIDWKLRFCIEGSPYLSRRPVSK